MAIPLPVDWEGRAVPVIRILNSRVDVITKERLQDIRQKLDSDDIFQPVFLENLIIVRSGNDKVDITNEAYKFLQSWGKVETNVMAGALNSQQVPDGPYIVFAGYFWQPWRLYEDYGETLMLSFRPCDLTERKYDVPFIYLSIASYC